MWTGLMEAAISRRQVEPTAVGHELTAVATRNLQDFFQRLAGKFVKDALGPCGSEHD